MPNENSDVLREPVLPSDLRRTGQAAVKPECVAPREAGPSALPTIVIHNPGDPNVRRLDDALMGCQVRLHSVSEISALAQLRCSEDCCIALVAVTGQPSPNSPPLDAVSVLKQKGYTVLCYWDGARKWALGAQCSLLLAGASRLLDSADAAFPCELRGWLEHALHAEAARHREDRRIKRQMLDMGVVGASQSITNVFWWVLRASLLSDLPVLITGETGTGKELVACAIHRLDPNRRDGPFVPVNCGAINTGLAESELFGHRRGAFTGAERNRKGLIRTALGGVLFLDEVGDLDASLQSKLLRVLQEHRVLGLGEDHEVQVNVRIIAATNRDLEDMVRKGTFRRDLFHRLNVLSVRIPALRERPDDIEPLVQHFLVQCAELAPQRSVSVSEEFVEALKRVELPGNVRQLENLVRRAFVTSNGDGPLRLNDLPPEVWLQLAPGRESLNAQQAISDLQVPPPANPDTIRHLDGHETLLDPVAVLEANSWKLGRCLDFCEHEIVLAALGISSGNRSRAARLLGISPRSIFNKMRKYRIGA